MAGAVIGSLRAELSASIAAFQSDLGKAAGYLKAFSIQAKAIGEGMKSVGETMALAITGPLLLLGKAALDQAKELREAQAQVRAALASTGGASGKTSEELENLAQKLENISVYDKADLLRGVTSHLLAFPNIAGPVFDRAQKAIVDLSARMGGDLEGATIKVGRALNDPIQGISALTRMGVQFTTQQKAQIEALVQSGQGYKAQGVILDALEQKFAGAAKAQRDATPTAALNQAWRNFTETVGNVLTPALTPLIQQLTDLINKFQTLTPATQEAAVKFAMIAAAVGPALVIVGSFITNVGKISGVLATVGKAIAGINFAPIIAGLAEFAAPIAIVAAALAALVALIWPFRDQIVKALDDLWAKAKETIGPAFQGLVSALGDAWTSLGKLFEDVWNSWIGDVLKALGEALASLVSWVIKNVGGLVVDTIAGVMTFIAKAVDFIVDSLKLIVHFLTGQWSEAWNDAKNAANDAIDAVNGNARSAGKGNTPATTKTTAPQKPVAPQAPAAPSVPTKPTTGFDLHNEDQIKKVVEATKSFQEALRNMDLRVSRGLDDLQLPKSVATANQLNAQLDEFVQKAKDSGVNTGKWSSQLAALRTRIEGLKLAGLNQEAKKFGEEVNSAVVAVNRFGNAGLDPLADKLETVDDQYRQLRDRIQNEIDANKALADMNEQAAASMRVLQDQLAKLDAAHQSARDAAVAQYEAENTLANLQSQANKLQTANSIADFKANSGRGGGPISSAQEKLQSITRDLAAQQIDAETKLQQLVAQRDQAARDNDQAQVERLNGEIDLQRRLYDLVSATSTDQIDSAQRVNEAFKSFTDSLSDSLTSMIMNWKFDLNGLRNIFAQLAQELFVKPFVSAGSDLLGGVLKSFAGGFAGGGFIPPGQWGVVGEKAPEVAYGGRTGATIEPVGSAYSATQNFYISTPDANSFRKSQRQIARAAKQGLGIA